MGLHGRLAAEQLPTQFPTFSLTERFPGSGHLFILLPARTVVTDIGTFLPGSYWDLR
jgi:hypothetical protein